MTLPETDVRGPLQFPTTHWSMLKAVGGDMTPEHREAMNQLILRYWRPVYVFISRAGHRDAAADLTQDFFVHCLQRELFGKADRARGRFRTFLLACLKNFLADAKRQKRVRKPVEGIFSIQQLATDSGAVAETADERTPEADFDHAWVANLLQQVTGSLEQELLAAGQGVHLELFRRRILQPILDNREAPQLTELAAEFGLSMKQASNCVITARRTFQRLLREEIRSYAGTDQEVASEIQDLFRFASKP